ncbi:MAG: inositol monophosphatase family protein [Gammaproteobacteria bacterium]
MGRIWDVAAGALAVEEAGGVVRRFNGAGIDYQCAPNLRTVSI